MKTLPAKPPMLRLIDTLEFDREFKNALWGEIARIDRWGDTRLVLFVWELRNYIDKIKMLGGQAQPQAHRALKYAIKHKADGYFI